jgi:hypothetical protein
MFFEWLVTIFHAVLCLVMIYGVLFSKTVIAQSAVLAILMLLFIGIRLFGTCALDTSEVCEGKPILADIGLATLLKDYKNVNKFFYEQSVVGSLLLIHVIKIYSLSIYPIDTLF